MCILQKLSIFNTHSEILMVELFKVLNESLYEFNSAGMAWNVAFEAFEQGKHIRLSLTE